MKSRIPRIIGAAAVALALAIPAAAQAVPNYYPSGPQESVGIAELRNAGWSPCYVGSMGDSASLATIATDCDEAYLMMASLNSYSYQLGTYFYGGLELLAAAPREDVLFATGSDPRASHPANGSEWYYAPGTSGSWGFAKGGDAVNRSPCDNSSGETNPALRMCWNLDATTLAPGQRVGWTTVSDSRYVRLIFEHKGYLASGSPDPVVFATQTQDTVSPTRTVTFTIDAAPGASLGEPKFSGGDQDDFWVSSDTCPRVVAAPGTGTCTANVRFIPQAQGARSTTLRFANDPGSAVAVQGTGGAPTQPADGADGTDGTNGTAGVGGTAGTDGVQGAQGAQGVNGVQGLQGEPGSGTARRVTKVRCSVRARRSGARMVCRFNRRARHSWLVQLRDRRGALSTARGNGKRTMVFLSQRRPRGTMRAFVIKGLRTSR